MHPYLKIKTNNIKALDARPNIGYIPPGDTVKITVKREEEISNNLKLQISTLECHEQYNGDKNFKELWTKYESHQASVTLPVRILQKEEGHKILQPTERSNFQKQESENNIFQSIASEPISQYHSEEQNQSIIEKANRPFISNESTVKSRIEEKISENDILVINNLSEKKKLLSREIELERLAKSFDFKEKPSSLQNCSKSQNSNNKFTILITALAFFIVGYYFGGSVVESETSELENTKKLLTQNTFSMEADKIEEIEEILNENKMGL